MKNRERKATTDETLARLMKEVVEVSRIEAKRYLAQLEDGFARLCDDNYVAEATIQLITERSSHIPPYTVEQVTSGYRVRRL